MKLLYAIPIVLLLVIITAVFILPARMTVAVTDDKVSINLSSNIIYSDLTIKFNAYGTHIKDGFLKVRLDYYPQPGTDLYTAHYIGGVLNPCLCQFIYVPEDIKANQLENYIKQVVKGGDITLMNDYLLLSNSAHYVSPHFKDKCKLEKKLITGSPDDVIAAVNAELEEFEIEIASGAENKAVSPKSIDVGPGAIARAAADSVAKTVVMKDNPANADGSLDTWEFYFATNASNVESATFYVVSGNNLSTRDTETIGSVTGGSKQTFTGLDTDVVTGDYAGYYWSGGNSTRDTTGFAGFWFVASDQIPCTNQAFTSVANYTYSVYATGTESGGTTSITNSPSSKAFGVIWPSSTYWSNTGNSTGFTDTLDDAEAFFTLTNDGDTTVDVVAKATNFSGGVGWTLTHSSPGENTVRMSVFNEGGGTSDNLTLKTTDQAFISSLAASGTTDWEIKLETGTFTDGVAKSSTITLTASAS